MLDRLYPRNPALLWWSLICIPLHVGRVQEAIPFLVGLPIVLVSTLMLGVVALFTRGLNPAQLRLAGNLPGFKPMTFIIVWSGIGILGSIWPARTVGRLEIMVMTWAVCVFLVFAVNDRKDLRKVLGATLVTLAILCVAAFLFPKFRGGRLHVGYTYDPNDLALALIMLTLVFSRFRLSGLKRLGRWALYLVVLYIVFKSGSRGAAVALLGAIAFHGLRGGVRRTLKYAAVALLLVVMVYPLVQGKLGRFETIGDEEDYNYTSKHGRLEIWKRGLKIMTDNPVFGTGLGTFVVAEGQSNAGGRWMYAHNSFIEVGGELGLPGLIAFGLMLFRAFRSAGRKTDDRWMDELGAGLQLGLVAFACGGFFLSWAYKFPIYFLIALAMARQKMLAIERMRSARVSEASNESTHLGSGRGRLSEAGP